jgi:hypothetical protein
VGLAVQLHRGADARCLRQTKVSGEQGRVRYLDQSHVGRVVVGQVFSQLPNASGERGVRITDRLHLMEEVQDEPALFPGQISAERVASQCVEHLYVKEVRDVHFSGGLS